MSKRSEADRENQDVGTYMASANPSSDIQKTEEFLKSKVQSGTSFYQFTNDDGTVIGWGNLTLNAAAVDALDNYEGIEGHLMIDEVVDLRAV